MKIGEIHERCQGVLDAVSRIVVGEDEVRRVGGGR